MCNGQTQVVVALNPWRKVLIKYGQSEAMKNNVNFRDPGTPSSGV